MTERIKRLLSNSGKIVNNQFKVGILVNFEGGFRERLRIVLAALLNRPIRVTLGITDDDAETIALNIIKMLGEEYAKDEQFR